MLSNLQKCGKYTVYKLSIDPGDTLEMRTRKPIAKPTNLVTVNVMLEGSCTLNVSGNIDNNGQSEAYLSSRTIPELGEFSEYHQNNIWIGEAKVLMTVDATSLYACIYVAPFGIKPLTYVKMTAAQVNVPAGALFFVTADCTTNGTTYIKNEPYVNDSGSQITLNTTPGMSVLIIEEIQ